jgi:hypothetical protein
MFGDLWDFILAVFQQLLVALTGTLLSVIGLVWELVAWARKLETPKFKPRLLWAPGLFLLFVASFMAWRLQHGELTHFRRQRDAQSLYVECSRTFAPQPATLRGVTYVLSIQEWRPPDGGGLGKYQGAFEWPAQRKNALLHLVECKLTNVGTTNPLTDVEIDLRMTFYEANVEATPNGFGQKRGALKFERAWPLSLGVIAPGGSFAFYIYNHSTAWVTIGWPDEAEVRAGDAVHTVKLSQHRMNTNALTFVSFLHPEEK